jgi:hypothetical protein
MADEDHLSVLKQGVEVWNQCRRTHPSDRAGLSEVNLRGADLS